MKIRFVISIMLFILGLSIQGYAQKEGDSGSNCVEVVNIVAYTPTVCLGESVELTPGVGGNRFDWFPITGILDLNSGTPMASPTRTTTYTVTGYSDTGCSYHTFTLTVLENGANCKDETSNNIAQTSGSFEADANDNLAIRYSNGKVIIGDSTLQKPGAYQLYIKDGILSEKINIAIKESTDWADDVFEGNYPLNSIEEVATFIQKNKHLPNIPSAQEVVGKGINIGETEANLLRQIEEIWLHLIEIDKDNEVLEKQNHRLETRIKALEH